MVKAEQLRLATHTRLQECIQREGRPAEYLLVDSATQSLCLCSAGQVLQRYLVSTAKNGIGAECNSFKTPPGLHQISEIIGDGAMPGLIFKGRIAQPLCSKIETQPTSSGIDVITSRVLRLDGLEPGVNLGGNCDSRARYIYIHGTADEGLLGRPVSHGCIRMSNTDVIELSAKLQTRSLVYIY